MSHVGAVSAGVAQIPGVVESGLTAASACVECVTRCAGWGRVVSEARCVAFLFSKAFKCFQYVVIAARVPYSVCLFIL